LKPDWGESYTFISSESFKSGKTRLAFLLSNPPKEMIESIINSLRNVLLDLAINRNIKIFCKFIQIKLSEIIFIFFVSINLGFKKFVIDKTAIRNSFVQPNNLLFRRIYSESEIHLRRHTKTNTNIFMYFSIQEIKLGDAIHLQPKGWSFLANESV